MGGLGSGNWWRRGNRKATVEESLTLAIADFRDLLFSSASGRFTWEWFAGYESVVRYSVKWHKSPVITLKYYATDGTDVELPVHLQNTATQFNGKRWWFTCPLLAEGMPCNRRVGKLHLPPGARYFGCRVCHDLTYKSCQRSRNPDGLLEWMKAQRPCATSH